MIYATSFLIPLLALLPNLFFAAAGGRRPPGAAPSTGGRPAGPQSGFASSLVGAGGATGTEPLPYVLLERVGQVGVFLSPLLYPIRVGSSLDLVALFGMAVALGIYYACWTRYFIRGRKRSLLFKSLIGIPIPMAVSPVAYFLFAAWILQAPILLIAAVLLAGGHIPITLLQRKAAGQPGR